MGEATETKSPREMVGAFAQACLDHVRAVRWGEGSADYEVNDGAARLQIHISVKTIGKARV